MIALNYRDPRPLYEQVRDGMRRLIETGAIAEGEKLPSVRQMAGSLAINPNTIQRAYNELEVEGFAVSVPGKGSFAVRGVDRLEEKRAQLRALARELRAGGVTQREIEELCREEEDE